MDNTMQHRLAKASDYLAIAARIMKKKRLSADEKEYAAHAIDRAAELLEGILEL